MRQQISRLAVGLFLALFASQSMATVTCESEWGFIHKFKSVDDLNGLGNDSGFDSEGNDIWCVAITGIEDLATYRGSDEVGLAMDENGGAALFLRHLRHVAEQDALHGCKKRSRRSETCTIVNLDDQSTWLREATSAASFILEKRVWCVYRKCCRPSDRRKVNIDNFSEAYCRQINGQSFATKELADAEYRRLKLGSSTSYASSSSSNSGPYVWCGSESGVSFIPSGSCQYLKGKGFSNKRLAEDYRLKSSSSTSIASSGSFRPTHESSCKELWHRLGVEGPLSINWYNTKCSQYVSEDGYRWLGSENFPHQVATSSAASSKPAPQISATASLTIRSNVRGDRVYIDGKYKGSTRLDLDLPKGRHTIRIEKDGYKTYEEAIDLKNTLTLRTSLEKIAKKPVQTASMDNSSIEVTFWKSIQGSKDAAEYRAYLESFPKGKFAPLAKIKIKKLGGTSVAKSSIPNLDYGRYHALVIGNDRYRHLKKLSTAVNDAKSIASLLRSQYGFEVNVLTNATRHETVSALSELRQKISPKDNLLVYYAGHGWLDKAMDEGFWLPVDAVEDNPVEWLSNATVVGMVRAMKAKHVMVVADSCFSGTLVRGLKIKERSPDYIQRMVKKKARTALTSGGLEPVTDVGGGNHSVFAQSFMRILTENDGVLDGHQLFTTLRRQVMMGSDQTPEYGDIRKAGHDGGDFLFVRK